MDLRPVEPASGRINPVWVLCDGPSPFLTFLRRPGLCPGRDPEWVIPRRTVWVPKRVTVSEDSGTREPDARGPERDVGTSLCPTVLSTTNLRWD